MGHPGFYTWRRRDFAVGFIILKGVVVEKSLAYFLEGVFSNPALDAVSRIHALIVRIQSLESFGDEYDEYLLMLQELIQQCDPKLQSQVAFSTVTALSLHEQNLRARGLQ